MNVTFIEVNSSTGLHSHLHALNLKKKLVIQYVILTF